MDWKDYIVTNEEILAGKPVIKGTRISVEHIVSLLASGWTEKQILENYPRLTQNHLQALFAFIQDCMKDGLLYNQAIKSL